MSDETSKRSNSNLHTFPISIFIPFSQAVLTGIVAGILAFAFALTFNKNTPLIWLLWGFLLPTALLWMMLLKRWIKLTDWLPAVEKMTNLDINQDGRVGHKMPSMDVVPEPKQLTVTVRDIHDQGSLSVMRYNLPVSEKQIREFSLGVKQGVSLAEANWIGPAHPFTRDEYRAFRGELTRKRWAELSNHKSANQGFQMTSAGQAVMREIARTYSPTTDVDT
jgi:hypothetical protein